MTVNHDVAGSSPAGGATKRLENIMFSSLFFAFTAYNIIHFLRFISYRSTALLRGSAE